MMLLLQKIAIKDLITPAVNYISESAILNSSKPIKFSHLQKLPNQSKLKGAHVVEIKSRSSMVVPCRETWQFGKKSNMVKKYLKALALCVRVCMYVCMCVCVLTFFHRKGFS